MSRLLILLIAVSVLGSDIPLSEFASRRTIFREALQDRFAVIHGETEKGSHENRDGFFQSPDFYYLTGIRDPGGVLVLSKDQETLYLSKRDEKAERWHGPRLSLEDKVTDLTGIQDVRALDILEKDLRKLRKKNQADAAKLLALQRMQKSPAEIAVIRKAIAATIAAHRAAWASMEPGKFEYQIANVLTAAYRDRGCQRNAYPPIIGSGPNATILHYFRNSRRIDAGELILMDAGAECDGYAADITRTVPVNGKFTDRQKQLYQAVLQAQRTVIAAARPGVTIKQLRQTATDALNAGEIKLGHLMIHGVSHHIGLNVHDAADNELPLQAGAVITVEPGVYLPDENIGIRIEDMVLITPDGATVLTSDLPVEIEEIERAMARQTP